ncbi:MAG: hypothetical protein QM529_00010 [Hydrotalea sp.]|nr:hypothetical protein [Hydrotalea sp.]
MTNNQNNNSGNNNSGNSGARSQGTPSQGSQSNNGGNAQTPIITHSVRTYDRKPR